MAIVVVAILMLAVSPVIVLSVASRVQSRRVELATQAARTYIDGVRNGTIPPPSNTIPLNDNLQRSNFAGAAVPTTGANSFPSCSGNQYCQNSSTSSLYCIDIDGGGCNNSTTSKDLVVQAFRSYNSTTNSTADPNQGYLLGVRVYRADAFNDSSPLLTTNQINTKQATFTGGLGARKAPLVEMTTEIVTSQTNYGSFCSRLSGCQ